jgi:autotransporter-associated beta strand protein
VGTGVFTIGSPDTLGASAEPTIIAAGAPRTIANPVVVANNFSVGGTNALTLSGALDLGAAARFVTVNNASPVTFSGTITGAAGSALVKDGPGTLVLSGANSYAGPTVAGGGMLTFAASQTLGGTLTVAGGATAELTPGGNKVIVAPDVSVESSTGSRLDLTNNNLIVDYDAANPIARLTALVAAAHSGGLWTGAGITSSTAASVGSHGIGIGDATALGITTFAGQSVNTATLLRYTRYGDANVDGVVNLADFNLFAANFGFSGRFWYEGDFTYDGTVDLADFNRLAANFGLSASSAGPTAADWAALAMAVPEPSCAVGAVLALATTAVCRPPRGRSRATPAPKSPLFH